MDDYLSISDFKEQLLLPGSKACYTPGFLILDLSFPVDVRNIAALSSEELGTFTHEYIHYLQNISTPFGIWESMVLYSALSDFFKYVQTAHKPLNIPIKGYNVTPEVKKRINCLREINGCIDFFYLNDSKKLSFSRSNVDVAGRPMERITLHGTQENGSPIDFVLGAKIIKESMAAMFQEIIDPQSKKHHKDVPYNAVSILAAQYFPNICTDVKKLAAICFISLFTLSPGVKLIDFLSWANDNPEKSMLEIFDHFISNSTVIKNDGIRMTVEELSVDIVENTKKILSKQLYGDLNYPLDFVGEILDRAKMAEGLIPLLRILTENDISPELMQLVVESCGIPMIISPYGSLNIPTPVYSGTAATNNASSDVLILSSQWAAWKKLTDSKYYLCPLHSVCGTPHGYFKDECEGEEPWQGKMCLMTIIGNRLGLTKKT